MAYLQRKYQKVHSAKKTVINRIVFYSNSQFSGIKWKNTNSINESTDKTLSEFLLFLSIEKKEFLVMYHITIKNQDFEVTVNENNPTTGTVNGAPFEIKTEAIKRKVYKVTYNDTVYFILVKSFEAFEKIMTLQINHQTLKLKITDEIDEMLKSLGIDYSDSLKIREVKAPMPGLVLDVTVEEGNEVKKGDNLLVLEAMKMENNIKSPSDGIIKSITVTKGKAVEKNEVLVLFD